MPRDEQELLQERPRDAMEFRGATIPDRAHGALLQTSVRAWLAQFHDRVLRTQLPAFINLTRTAFCLHEKLA
jgi:hypothetical protein